MGKKSSFKKLTEKNEFFVLLTVVILIIVISLINPAFATPFSAVDILRAGIELAIFAIGMYMVIVSAGIDVSCASIGMFSMFTTTKILFTIDFDGPIIVAYLISALLGLAWGFVNGIIITKLKILPLIATLATNGIMMGILLFFIGSREISDVPMPFRAENKHMMLTLTNEYGISSSLPYTFLILVGIGLVVFVIMNYTVLGRNIYAIGGDEISAERVGINVDFSKIFTYSFAGAIFGIGGMVHTIMMANSNPVDLTGKEMITIAAVVIGGVRLTGGHGTLFGTILGAFLVTIVNNSLILIGIPSFWQRFVTGAIIVIGASISAYQELRVSRQMRVEVAN
jgi:simple sugar transport system permease protein